MAQKGDLMTARPDIRVLDATIRDGGLVNNFMFTDDFINALYRANVKAGIDYMEFGYKASKELFDVNKFGKWKFCDEAAIREIVGDNNSDMKISVMADVGRCDYKKDILPREDSVIDMVRVATYVHQMPAAIEMIEDAKSKGYEVTCNIMAISNTQESDLNQALDMVAKSSADGIYIVDSYGALYPEQIRRTAEKYTEIAEANGKFVGMHAHNNQQLAFANTIEAAAQGVSLLDATMMGMGRGAGNTNTELVMQYMNRKFNSGYDIDIVLDLIDNYIDGFHNSYEWGYSIPYFLAGSHSAHVNNISYLSAKAGIASRDINFLLNRLDPVERKRYDYSLLEKTYLDYQNTHCEDDSAIASLQNALSGKDILVLLPGHTIKTCQGQIQHFYKEKNPIVISVNLLTDCYPIDFAYFSNKNRYQYWRNEAAFNKCKKIVTSNVTTRKDDNLFIIDFLRLVKCGWEQLDNSGVLLLRLLDLMNVNSISIAGFDGYSHNSENPNYVEKAMEKTRNTLNAEEANKDIKSMLVDYKNTRKSSCPISFITPSYFETVMDE